MCRTTVAVVTIAVVTLVGTAVTSRCGAIELKSSFSITAEGDVVASAPAIVPEPAQCLGPLSLVSTRVAVNNDSLTPEDVVVTVALGAGLHMDPGSGCVATLGTCSVTSPSMIDWTVTVPALDVEALFFAPRIDADVPRGTQVCETVTFTVNGGMPQVITACATTNSANQCGLGAPALSEISLVLLILALGAGGILVLSRGRS